MAGDAAPSPLDQPPITALDEQTVSVIIPCFNQAHFLRDAIESVLAQTYPRVEIIVVDDGSPDATAEVAASYPGVKCVRQENMGVATARNAGFRASAGDFLVFLDADDRLLPDAVSIGVEALKTHPECAFVYGHSRDIAADGSPLPAFARRCVEGNYYSELLKTNYIFVPAMVMYRRETLESVSGFNPSVNASADYDIYLRISRTAPIFCHGGEVVEYRQHGSNMSRDSALMLQVTLKVMRSQWPHVRGDEELERAYKEGFQRWREKYGELLVNDARRAARTQDWGMVLDSTYVLLKHSPRTLAKHIFRKLYRVAFRDGSEDDHDSPSAR